ncbi:hypothetical protein C1H46_029063 [Malus baccata]|uniref:MADS-box domain-containing protein n=1 Tax=Malus baccata TaxID=106549 RepID=A0A540LFW8_MALBA|nr:hypothetical protein C1H46_029063 [Malus baccata]
MAKSPDNRITNKDAENGKKESKSRRSVEIKKVEDKNKRHVTFSKRKRGLFNKTSELSVLTGAETAAIVVLNSGKVFCFVNHPPDAVIECYFGHNASLSADYEKASRLLKEEKILKGGKKSKSNNNGGDEGGCTYGWWERPIGMMSILEELEEYREAMNKLKHNVEVRTNQLIRETTPPDHFSSLLSMDDTWSPPKLSQGQGCIGCMGREFYYFL